MRFHCLMVLRDEQDVIAQNLAHLLSWADGVYVLDLGSTDATWDLVQDLARRDKRIVIFKQSPIVYSDSLRSIMFAEYRNRFENGDWVLRVDADEFYHVPPPQFVKERMRPLEGSAWLQWYFFRLLKGEVEDYESGKVDVKAERRQTITERRRYYKISEYGEPRMFRYRRGMQWSQNASFPFNAGLVARQRLPIRHYPHRDPLQMDARFRLRARMMMLQANAGSHWKVEDWHDELVDEQGVSESSKGKKRGLAGEIGIDTGPLLHWVPGTELPERPIINRFPLKKLATQRIIYPLLAPLLDLRRPRWDSSYEPELLPAHMQVGFGEKTKPMDLAELLETSK